MKEASSSSTRPACQQLKTDELYLLTENKYKNHRI